MSIDERFRDQLEFLGQAGLLTTVVRKTFVCNGDRMENSAEHTFFIVLLARILAADCGVKLDTQRVLDLVLIHDLVEVFAGDHPLIDGVPKQEQRDKEIVAADRLFSLLPSDQAAEFRALWNEFELGQGPEAKAARALDKLAGFLTNYFAGGTLWRQNKITRSWTMNQKADCIREGTPSLWPYFEAMVDKAVSRGWLIGD